MLDEKLGSEWLKMTNTKMIQGIGFELIDAFDKLTGLQYNVDIKKNLKTSDFYFLDLHSQHVYSFFCCDPILYFCLSEPTKYDDTCRCSHLLLG